MELWRCCGVVEVVLSCGGGVELWRWCCGVVVVEVVLSCGGGVELWWWC